MMNVNAQIARELTQIQQRLKAMTALVRFLETRIISLENPSSVDGDVLFVDARDDLNGRGR